jgi:glycosyltransferase involved in cell wall biosynthesis
MEHMVLRLAHAQRRRGLDARILALQPGDLLKEAHERRVPAHVLRGANRVFRGLDAAGFFLRSRPSVIHAHNVSSLQFSQLGKRLTGAALVLTCHGEFQQGHRAPSEEEWERVDSVIAVSEITASQVRRPQYDRKLQVIYNGVDLPTSVLERDSARRELGIGDEFVGIMVARIDKLKGHEILLDALELLHEHRAALRILIVGDGEERSYFERQAHVRGLTSLMFLGFRSDVSSLLKAADFFVLPSYTEGLPLSVLEAMAHTLPVIATPVGGIPELIEDGREGILVPVRDSRALADAVMRLNSDRTFARELAGSAFEKILQGFTFDRMVDKYSGAYAEARLLS